MLNHATKTHTAETWNGNGNGNGQGQAPTDPLAKLHDLEAQIEELKKNLAVARGTENDVKPPPEAKPAKPDLITRMEQVLRTNIVTTEELAKAVGESVDKVKVKIKEIRKHVADVGTPDQARWLWRVGDSSSAKELKDTVRRLITGHKRTTAELTKITGARMSRVNGVLVELQRATKVVNGEVKPAYAIFNAGTDYRAEWFIVPESARPANLPPKAKK